MFLLNLGYRWSYQGSPNGLIYNASGLNMEQATRRKQGEEQPEVIMFDPQLYLINIDPDECLATCAKLSTYPWFPTTVEEFDSSEMNQKEWFKAVKKSISWDSELPEDPEIIEEMVEACLDYQTDFGVTDYIIPCPLIDNADDQFTEQLQWIDTALQLKENYDGPFLATIALLDQVLLHTKPDNNQLLESILDNLTVREDLDGIYLLVVQSLDNTPRIMRHRIAYSLLKLSNVLGEKAGKKVIINFTDSLGLICLGVGAAGFASGYTNKAKRLNFNDFVDRGGGSAYPRFYSHNLIADFLSETDLEKIRNADLLRYLFEDVTQPSRPLLDTLKKGMPTSSIPQWRQSKNNVAAAEYHRTERFMKAVEELKLGTRSISDVAGDILIWLQDAEARMSYLCQRFNSDPLSEDCRHHNVWRSAFESYLKKNPL